MAVFNSFFSMFVHRKCMANGSTTKGFISEKNSVESKFVAISEFGGISGGDIAGYNCI